MTIPIHSRNRRLVQFVGLLKSGVATNAPQFRRWLKRHGRDQVCLKTVKRDISYLRDELGAPVEYDALQNGYVLYNPEWTFPYAELEGDELFAAVLGESLVKNVIPHPFNASLDSAMRVQLAAGEPEGIDPQLLSSVAIATTSKLSANVTEVFDTVSQAWRNTRRLKIDYKNANADSYNKRDVDVHALFLADSAWYARVYCHLRQDYRSLAIHRISKPVLLDECFERSDKIVRDIQSGHVFDYETVRNITVICDAAKAGIIREREWFPGQTIRANSDGTLELAIPEAPHPVLVWWVLSYAGHLTVTNPPEIAEEIKAAARKILENH